MYNCDIGEAFDEDLFYEISEKLEENNLKGNTISESAEGFLSRTFTFEGWKALFLSCDNSGVHIISDIDVDLILEQNN